VWVNRPFTAEANVRSQVSPCEICGGRSATWTSFSPSTSVFLCHYHSTVAPYSSTCCAYLKDKRAKQYSCGNRGALNKKVHSLLLVSEGLQDGGGTKMALLEASFRNLYGIVDPASAPLPPLYKIISIR